MNDNKKKHISFGEGYAEGFNPSPERNRKIIYAGFGEVQDHHGRYILDDEGDIQAEPDLIKWAMWMEKADRTVLLDKVGPAEVSTVFLGLDHNHLAGDPILFETMVRVPSEKEFLEVYYIQKSQMRYRTKEEAFEGHAYVVNFLKSICMDKQGGGRC